MMANVDPRKTLEAPLEELLPLPANVTLLGEDTAESRSAVICAVAEMDVDYLVDSFFKEAGVESVTA